ncbi:DNA polymerase alpha subunit B isoform X2 [Bicyclus anynana]|uniref:DNA polymerase alpha subunit B n=1 Tax=Bicyclus anynana TaxID=110368 RepID=A0ABM3LYM1_BICAN|nr:DNA polymerase alpha subunit B isoform X2 [Bicyclus anynana]
MATEELVTEQFQFLGIEVPKEVLSKCVSLCAEYDVDAETFIEQWMAFSLTALNGAGPTLENINLLEKREFSKRSATRNTNDTTGTSLTVYGAPASIQPENEVLSNYMSDTPKRVKTEHTEQSSNQIELRPATYSPSVDHSGKYSSRTNQGSVVYSYGDEKLLATLANATSASDITDLNISQVRNDDGELYTKAMFGFELLHEKASTFDNHIRYISQCIMKKNGITESSSVRHKTQTEVYVAGRIECDADARLNSKSVVLQGTWDESLSLVVPVDLDNVAQYSLFPGQVVVLKGVNPRGDKFIARRVVTDAARPAPAPNADLMNTLKGTISMVISAGPYTTSTNMAYEPLKDLISYVSAHKPQLLLMTGPLLDCDHAKVKDHSMAETYKAFFDKLLDNIGEIATASPFTKIYIVSSQKDAFHVNIYPTPAYSSRKRHPNIHFVPDPCTLNVDGVLVGITSTDVLMHISQEEISLK